MTRITTIRIFIQCISLTIIFSAGSAYAEVDASFRVGYAWSDNITRVPVDPVDEQIQLAGFDFNYIEETRKFDISILSGFDYLRYTDDTFDDDVVGGVIGDVTYWFIEERLNWIILENYGQQLVNPLVAETPGNRQNVNYLTTGPTLILPMGTRNSFQAELRYSDVSYEDNGLDNTRNTARLALLRDLSEYSSLSFNVRAKQVNFDDTTAATDYDVNDLFLRFESSSPRNTVVLDAGWVEVDLGDQKEDGFLFALTWERDITPSSSVSLNGGTGFSDQGELFRDLQTTDRDVGRTVDTNASSQPFHYDYVGVRYTLSAPRTETSIGFGWNEEDYEFGSNLDRTSKTARLSVERAVTQNLAAVAYVDFASRDYTEIDRINDDLRGGLSLKYALGATWSVSALAQYIDRESTDTQFSYTEKRYVLQFEYVPDWGRPAEL